MVEDLHWADAETLTVVEHLADHAAGEPILCVGIRLRYRHRTESARYVRDATRADHRGSRRIREGWTRPHTAVTATSPCKARRSSGLRV